MHKKSHTLGILLRKAPLLLCILYFLCALPRQAIPKRRSTAQAYISRACLLTTNLAPAPGAGAEAARVG